jgi:hypothetical protein
MKLPSSARPILLGLLAAITPFPLPAASGQAPYVDSQAIKDRFDQITAADMDMLRQKKIILASRSFGLNLVKGLGQLAKLDPKYDLTSSYQRFDVNKAGGDVGIIPADFFQGKNFLHFLATVHPALKRVEEMEKLLSEPPHEFGKSADAVIIFYHTASPDTFEPYKKAMDAMQARFPKIRFIYVTSGLSGPKFAKNNENSMAFGEKARAELKGKVPLYDMAKILSDDFRDGPVYCPEYSADPADLHPNLPAGETMMAKGFLLVLKEAFAQDSPAASSTTPPAPATAVTPAPTPTTSVSQPETLTADHPDMKAVRAILDANGLQQKKAEGVSVVKGGRIVELFLQEGGITQLPDEIGTLTGLRKLHVYGDRNLPLPLLKSISPAIGQCTEIEELLINENNLATLPAEIIRLEKLTNLSIGDNQLVNLPPEVAQWAERFDPKGLANQKAPAMP